MKYKTYIGVISALALVIPILTSLMLTSGNYRNSLAKSKDEVDIKIDARKSLSEMPKVMRAGLMGMQAGENSRPLIMASEDLQLKPYLRTWIQIGTDITGSDAPREPKDFDKNFIDQIRKIDANLKQYQDRGFQLIVSIEGTTKWLSKYPSDECMPSTDGCFNKWPFSPPKDYKRWKVLIQKLVSTQIEDGVRADYIIWDEPDWMFYGTKEQYFELYKHAVTAIKEVNPTLKVGGPALSGFESLKESNCPIEDGFQNNKDNKEINCPKSEYSMMEEFINYVGKNKLPLDFIDWHFADQYAINNQTKIVREWLGRAGLPKNTPLSIGEWVYDGVSEVEATETGAANVISRLKAFADAGVYRHTASSVYDQCGWPSGSWQNVGYFDAKCPGEIRIGVIKAKWNSFKVIDKFIANSYILDIQTDAEKDDFITTLVSQTRDKKIIKVLISNLIPVGEKGRPIILQTLKSCMFSKDYTEDKLKQIYSALQQTVKVNPPKDGATFEYIRQIIQFTDFPSSFNDQKVKQHLNACLPQISEKAEEIQYYQKNPRKVKVFLSNLDYGTYTAKAYTIDKDHSNSCRYNKRTESTSTTTECGINGIIDQKIQAAEQGARQKGAQAAFSHLKSKGYTDEDIGLITEMVKRCERKIPCMTQAINQHYRQLDRCKNAKLVQECSSSEIVQSEIKETFIIFQETTSNLFYNFIDQINNLQEVSLEGSIKTREITIRGTHTQTFEMQPNSVMLVEYIKIR